MKRILSSVLLFPLFASCAGLASSRQFPDTSVDRGLGYDNGRIQGMLGLTELSNVDLDIDPRWRPFVQSWLPADGDDALAR